MKYRCYLFDFDYTLANSERGITTCFHRTLAELGCPDVPDETLRRTIGMEIEDAIRLVTGEDDAAHTARFLEIYRREADDHMTVNTLFYPNTVEVLRTLRRRGARTGIISSKTRSRILEKFRRDGAEDAIDLIVGIEDVARPKPDPEGIEKALDILGTTPNETLYIGDSLFDAEAAQNAAVDFAGVTTGTTTAEELARYPHVLIMDDLGELLGME